jgi:hypothetical protein
MVSSKTTRINELMISNAATTTTTTENHLSFLGRWVLDKNHNEQTDHLDWNNNNNNSSSRKK